MTVVMKIDLVGPRRRRLALDLNEAATACRLAPIGNRGPPRPRALIDT
jgi:hypothetical protein